MSLLRPILRRSSAIGRLLRLPCRTCLTFDRGGAYDGDGKTSLTVLNRDEEDMLLIDSYSSHGFRLNSGLFVCGPAAFFPRTIMHWDVEGPWDVTVGSLSLFWLLEPKPDLLIIGVGDKGMTIDDEVRLFMHKKKITMEILDTAHACAHFNWMNSDHRNVVAGLIPNQTMKLQLDTEQWDNVLVKHRLFHADGSSMNHVLDERERRIELMGLKAVEESLENKYDVENSVIAADLKEMMERGMITEAEVQRKYPYLSLEMIKKGGYALKDDEPVSLPPGLAKKLIRGAAPPANAAADKKETTDK